MPIILLFLFLQCLSAEETLISFSYIEQIWVSKTIRPHPPPPSSSSNNMAVPSSHAMTDTYPPSNNGTSKASMVQADGSIQPQANISSSANAALVNTPSIMQDYSFVMRKENGSTYIYPNNIQPGWTELKVGVLMPFHQQGNNYTRELTLT